MKRYLFLLVTFTFIGYFGSFANAFVWDDLNNITNNKGLEEPVSLKDVFLSPPKPPAQFYRPLPFLSIVWDHFLWGRNPLGFHISNFLFHLLGAVFVFLIAMRLSGSEAAAFICAVLFSLHPVQTEAVAYISGRSDPICAFFIFASFYFYLKALTPGIKKGGFYLFLSVILFLAALLSKEAAFIFPLLLLAYNIIFLKNRLRVKLKAVFPFAVVALFFFLFKRNFISAYYPILTKGGLAMLFKYFLFYLRLLLFPFNLHMQHTLKEVPWLLNLPYLALPVFFLCLVVIALIAGRKKSAVFGMAWFIIGILPFLGIFRLNAQIAEHWLYLPSFGIFLFAGVILSRRYLKFSFPVIAVIFLFLTINRNYVWRSDIAIYRDTLKYHNDDPRIHYNLGNAYLRRAQLQLAEQEYKSALRLEPDYAYALNNLGIIMEKKKRDSQAVGLYRKAARLAPELEAARKNLYRLRHRLRLSSLAFAQEVSPENPSSAVVARKNQKVDHSLYKKVLFRYLEDGRVDYPALKNNSALLDDYLNKMAIFDSDAFNLLPREEKISFYINVYNALTLKVITEHYPVKSIRSIPGVWDKLKFEVAGKKLSLGEIEHKILRKKFAEPRVHFALVCASIGCPQLSAEPFTGDNLDVQLDRVARKFINDKTKVRLDKERNVLYISSIFKWFAEDFGDVKEFISRYLSKGDARFIKDKQPRVKYLKYDWSLNDAKKRR